MTDSVMKWTLTVHQPDCRYASHDSRGVLQNYATEDVEKIQILQDYGFDNLGRYVRVVWKGCKVCGTALLEREFRALATSELARLADARRRQYAAREAENARREAKQERARAIELAQTAHYAEHYKDQIDTAMQAVAATVGARWDAENPEKVALFQIEDVEA